MDHPNRKVVFQPPFFRGYVKLPGCKSKRHLCQCTHVEWWTTSDVAPRCGLSACEPPCHGDSLPVEVETNPPTWNEGSGLRTKSRIHGKFLLTWISLGTHHFDAYNILEGWLSATHGNLLALTGFSSRVGRLYPHFSSWNMPFWSRWLWRFLNRITDPMASSTSSGLSSVSMKSATAWTPCTVLNDMLWTQYRKNLPLWILSLEIERTSYLKCYHGFWIISCKPTHTHLW